MLCTLLLLASTPAWSQLNFPRLLSSNDLSTTGFAVVNPAATSAQVTFTLKSSSGATVVTSSQTIDAGGQLARLGSELFPDAAGGWVQATSTAPLQGFWLGGDFSTFADGGSAAAPGSDQVFPLATAQTEINIANTGNGSSTVVFKILSGTGAELAPAETRIIPGNGAFQIDANVLFPTVDFSQARHIRVTGTAPFAATSVVRGFLVDTEIAVLNGVGVAGAPASLNFPHVVNGEIGAANYSTVVGVTNLSSSTQTVALTFHPEPSGAPILVSQSLPPGGSLRESAQALFNLPSSFQDGWVQVTGTAAITGFVAYAESNSGGLAVVPVQAVPQSSMFFLHIAGEPVWYSGLAVLNAGTVAANVEVFALTPTGSLIGGAANIPSAAFTLGPGRKSAKLLGELIPSTVSQNGGFVFIRTTNGVPLYGMELFGSLDGKILANVAAAAAPVGVTYVPPAPPPPSEPPTNPPPAGTTSSEALIDAALGRGEIDSETALTYKIFAAFGDPRLPSIYKSDSRGFETEVVSDLLTRFDSLSGATQSTLAPFLLRPSNLGSWLNPDAAGLSTPEGRKARPTCRGESSGWTTAGLGNTRVRVWYRFADPLEKNKAEVVSTALENLIWPNLITGLGFNEPLSDTSVLGCFGGDGRLDMYIVPDLGFRGLTVEDFTAYYQSPTYVLLASWLSTDELLQAAAHEFMHAIQWSYRMNSTQKSYGWLRDAMANWAIDQVYGKDGQLEQTFADCYLKSVHLSLDKRTKGFCSQNPDYERDYGAYLFFQFVAKTQSASTIKNILAATTTKPTSIAAVDTTIAGGFENVWPDFAKTLWNQDPIKSRAKSFFTWDDLTLTPKLAPDLDKVTSANLGTLPVDSTDISDTLENLSIKYYHFTFSDTNTHFAIFNNTFYEPIKNGKKISVQALIKGPGATNWTEEDWSKFEWIGFCRDLKQQRIEQMIIIVSNAEATVPGFVTAPKQPRLTRNNIGCYGFEGTTTMVHSNDQGWTGGQIKVTTRAKYDAHFAPPYTDEGQGKLRIPFAGPLFGSATIQVEENYSMNGCDYRASKTLNETSILTGGGSVGVLIVSVFNEALPRDIREDMEAVTGPKPRGYFIQGASTTQFKGTVGGMECDAGEYETSAGDWLLTGYEPSQMPTVANDGHLRGSFRDPEDNTANVTWSWDLTPLQEP